MTKNERMRITAQENTLIALGFAFLGLCLLWAYA